MTESQLMYAAMLALTKQNMAFKLAPLSTAQMQGQVINRNIAVGETVVCWMNNSGELARVGDVPAHNGDFFVDDNNLMYYQKGSSGTEADNRLVVCNALSGDIISDSDVCLRFVLSGDNQVAAYCIEESYDEPRYSKWIVIYKDGTRSREIIRNRALYTGQSSPRYSISYRFGYRNGVLAVCSGTSGTYGFAVSTYTKDGTLVNDLVAGRAIYPGGEVICPINNSTVCIAQTAATAFWNVTYTRVDYYTTIGITSYDPTEGYLSQDGQQVRWIGTDQVYCYIAIRICENVAEEGQTAEYVWLDQWDILRVAIDSYSVEKIKTIFGVLSYPYSYTSGASPFGHIIQEITVGGDTVRSMIDISTMTDVYTGDLSNLPMTQIQENVGWIWIPDKGIYQKTPLDWLMSATGEYPRSSPWGKCGYAIGDYKVGQNGLAIVLFE